MNHETIRVAVAQIPVSSTSVALNINNHEEAIRKAGLQGARLLAFPECALTGYDFTTREECQAVALRNESPPIQAIQAASTEYDVVVITGWLEQCEDDENVIYNTVGIFQGAQLTKYRKIFIPDISADKFVTPGDLGPVVCPTQFGVIGLAVCYDLRFPELTRELWKKGMQMLVVPTNWSATARRVATGVVQARAVENGVPVIVANRGDEDSQSTYIGFSSITLASGERIAETGRGEQLLIADIPASDITEGAQETEGVPRENLRYAFQRFGGVLSV